MLYHTVRLTLSPEPKNLFNQLLSAPGRKANKRQKFKVRPKVTEIFRLGQQKTGGGGPRRYSNSDFFPPISPTEDQQTNALPGFDYNPSTIL
jgi:hypothetical protein